MAGRHAEIVAPRWRRIPIVAVALATLASVGSAAAATTTSHSSQSGAQRATCSAKKRCTTSAAPSSSAPASSITSSPSPSTAAPTTTAAPSSSPTAAPAALSIRVSGNGLVDGKGNPVQLRGVNRSGTQYACAEGWGIFDGPSSDASLDAMKAWGINAVRVNGNEDCWLAINGVKAAYSGQNYITALVDYVRRINAHGMYVIFDLHHSAPGTQLATGQQTMADRDHSDAYWASVAATFKDDPAVLFDLYNEPHPDSNHDSTAAWTCVRDGGSCPGVSFTAAGSQEMLNAVRGAGASNVVLVGGPQYAGDVDKWTQYVPSDPQHQLAASIHIYYQTPSNPEWAPCDYLSCWDTTMATLAATTPIVIGELGEHDCNTDLIDGTALSPQQPSLLSWADQHGISYLAWSWFAGNCTGE